MIEHVLVTYEIILFLCVIFVLICSLLYIKVWLLGNKERIYFIVNLTVEL